MSDIRNFSSDENIARCLIAWESGKKITRISVDDLLKAREAQFKKIKASFDAGNNVCERCCVNPGAVRVDPYLNDVDDQVVYIICCESCYSDLEGDI